jgi:glycosyltransferase involved in cell wall biosynthesis
MNSDNGVLLLTEAFRPNVGGVETFLDHLASYLLVKKYRVYVLTYQPLTSSARGEGFEKSGSLEIRRVRWFGNGWRPRLEGFPPLLFLYLFPGLFFAGLIFMLTHRRQVQVIHAQSLVTTIIAVILAWLFRKRLVSTLHTIFRFEEKKALSWLLHPFLSRVNSWAVIAPGAKDELVALGIESSKIRVFTHWVDLELYRPLDKRKCQLALGLTGRFVFLFVGRLHPQKNVHLVLEAANLLRSEEVAFVFVGDGLLYEDVHRASQDNQGIVLLGPKKADELASIYSAADLYWGDLDVDYLSRVSIEAFACGIPVLAPSRINSLGVTREVKRDVFSTALSEGLLTLVEPKPEALAQAIRQFRHRQQDATSLSAQCRHYAMTYHGEGNAHIIELAYGNRP